MKKICFVFLSMIVSGAAFSQGITLSGTSYLQNFDSLGVTTVNNGLPQGWTVRTAASGSMLGTDVSSTHFTATHRPWDGITGEFRNCASADGFLHQAGSTDALQDSSLNRCLAVRQDNQANTNFPNSDSGSAFVLEITNTTGLKNFTLQFKLQSLDSGNANPPVYDTITHKATWSVDYGFGTNPDTFFLAPTTGVMTTGGCIDSATGVWSNNSITANFGDSLDNRSGTVWIRVITRVFSTYCTAGLKPTSGIDDFYLTYTRTTGVANIYSENLPLQVLGMATANEMSVLFYTPQSGTYDLGIFDLMGREVYKQAMNCTTGEQRLTVRDMNLVPGLYVVKINNGYTYGVVKTTVQ